MTVARWALLAGCLLGGVAVATGAFGAHGLKATLAATGRAEDWETACRYAMYHALALVAVGLFAAHHGPDGGGPIAAAGWCFLLGTLVFSGCLGTLALSGLKVLGAIVPVGGLLLIAGWALFAVAAARTR